jgi:hypothetical protein
LAHWVADVRAYDFLVRRGWPVDWAAVADEYHYGLLPKEMQTEYSFADTALFFDAPGADGGFGDTSFGWPPSGSSAEIVLRVQYETALSNWELESELASDGGFWGRLSRALDSAARLGGAVR